MYDFFNLDEIINQKRFKYNKKASPAYNYLLFQQAISFANRVEFLSSSNQSTEPIIYLLSVPELSIDLKSAKNQLEIFHKDLDQQLSDIMLKENNLFEMYKDYFELYNAVNIQQLEYKAGRDKYFGRVTLREFPIKDLKNLKLPLISSYYRGVFLNGGMGTSTQVEYNKLGAEMKKYLSDLYMLKRRFNMRLQKKLNDLKDILFFKKRESKYYRYKGDISDIVETAILIVKKGKVENMTSQNVSLNDFCKEYCNFFSLPFTKLSYYISILHTRSARGELFLKDASKTLNTHLESLK